MDIPEPDDYQSDSDYEPDDYQSDSDYEKESKNKSKNVDNELEDNNDMAMVIPAMFDDSDYENEDESENADNELEDNNDMAMAVPAMFDLPNFNRPFAKKLRSIIEFLVNMAQTPGQTDEFQHAMSPGFWTAFRTFDTDHWMNQFLMAIPSQVQHALEMPWTVQDLLDLPRIDENLCREKQGVYINIFTASTKKMRRDMIYIGSSRRCLVKRVTEHLEIKAKYTPETLPEKALFHYKWLCQQNTKANFRLLAVFGIPIEGGYILVLESIFILLIGTFFRGNATDKPTKETSNMVQILNDQLGVTGKAMGGNVGLPLRYPFPNPIYSTVLPCQNPVCGVATYPLGKEPDGERKRGRRPFDRTDLSKGFLCTVCVRYRSNHGRLPNKLSLSRANILWEEKRTVTDPRCDGCTQKWSEIGQINRLAFCKLFPGKRFCSSCKRFVGMHRRMRTAEELEKFLLNRKRRGITKALKMESN